MTDKPLVLTVAEKDEAEQLSATLKAHYQIGIATSGDKALKYVRRKLPDLILLNSELCQLDNGRELCHEFKRNEATQDIPIIFTITNRNEKTRAFELGADGCLQKPFEPEEVRSQVGARVSLRQSQLALQNYSVTLEEKVKERTKELEESRLEIIRRLALASEYKDNDTGVHIWRMSEYSCALARAAGIDAKECDRLLHAAPMHDIGKVGIPDRVLLKAGKLNSEEWKVMQSHTTIGAKILSGSMSPLLQMAEEIAATHHEKWDGSGYPVGLMEGEIPIWSRIVAVADVFDALTMKRPYKEAWTVENSIAEIENGSGKHFDPEFVVHFKNILPEIIVIKTNFSEFEEAGIADSRLISSRTGGFVFSAKAGNPSPPVKGI